MNIGPFTLNIAERLNLSGAPHERWEISYSGERFAWHHLPAGAKHSVIAAEFADDIAAWCADLHDEAPAADTQHTPHLRLIDVATGEVLGSMPWAAEVPGLRNAIPDERCPTWLVTSSHPQMAMSMSEEEFFRLRPAMVALHTERLERADDERRLMIENTPARSWITKLLPGAILTNNPDQWRAPTSWEVRHIVGEGSLTGISGAKAAELVGISPTNFRKYTASDDAKNRQNMGFAVWHTLLHSLDIQRMKPWSGQ